MTRYKAQKVRPVDWNKQTTKQHSPVSALLERERTRYFSLPVYLTNTACGLLFAAVFVLLVVLMSDKITPYIYQLAEYFRCLLLIMMCCSYMLFLS